MAKKEACKDITHDSAYKCSDYTNVHICQRAAGHTSHEDNRKLHKCGLCNFQWNDGDTYDIKVKSSETRLCGTCNKPMEQDDFLGMRVWLCQECQEIEDETDVKEEKLPKQRMCPLGGPTHVIESGKCSYGYCEEHCQSYHSYMPRHREDLTTPMLPAPKEDVLKKPEPQPLAVPEMFFRPNDVDWR